jgi:glutathione S-transferase
VQVFQTLSTASGIHDKEEMLAARRALIEAGGAMHTKMMVIEKLLADSKTKYYLGDKPSLADVMIFVLMSIFASGCGSAWLV